MGGTTDATTSSPGLPLAMILVALGCALALSACGSSSRLSTASSSSGEAAGIRFADCMRGHGVPGFPDPSAGGGIKLTPGSGVNPQSPAFQSAQSACAKLMPGGGPARGEGSETRKLAMLRLAQCMRAHGLTTFPDPTATPPSPGADLGLAFGTPGAFIAVPRSMMESPAFKQAAAECSFPGAGGSAAAKRALAPPPQ